MIYVTAVVQSLGGSTCPTTGDGELHPDLLPFCRLRSTLQRFLLTRAGNGNQKGHTQQILPFTPFHKHLPIQK